jgi:hypothetical protein
MNIPEPKYLRMKPKLFQIYSLGSAGSTLTIEHNYDAAGWQTTGHLDMTGDAPLLPQGLPFNLGGAGILDEKLTLEDLPPCRTLQFRIGGSMTATLRYLGYAYYYDEMRFERDPIA